MSVFHAEKCAICRGPVELGPLDIRPVGDDKPLCRVCAGKLPAHRIVIRKRGLTNTDFPIVETGNLQTLKTEGRAVL